MLLPLEAALSPLGRPFGKPGIHPRWDNLLVGWKANESSSGSSPVPRADVLETYELSDINTTPSAAGLIGNAASFTAASGERLVNTSLALPSGSFTIVYAIKSPLAGTWRHLTIGDGTVGVSFLSVSGGTTYFQRYNSGAVSVSRLVPTNSFAIIFGWWNAAIGELGVQIGNGSPATTTTTAPAAATGIGLGASPAGGNPMTGLLDEIYVLAEAKDSNWRTEFDNGGAGRSYPS